MLVANLDLLSTTVFSESWAVLKVHLHVPFPFPSPVTVTVKFPLTDRKGSEPNVSVKWSVTNGTMINVDGDSDGHRHGDG